MKQMKLILTVLAVIIVVILGVGMLLPRDWKVERSISIKASPCVIYPLVANFKTGWPQWSSFDHEDKDIKYTFEGPEEGVGAKRLWTSSKMGDGYQEITSVDCKTHVDFKLVMTDRHMALDGTFKFEPTQDGQTIVTWTDSGTVGVNPLQRYMVFLIKNMIGKSFEKSLATLKIKAEEQAAACDKKEECCNDDQTCEKDAKESRD
jgi:hypothetical protein